MRQKSEGEAFLRIFPYERDVLAYFAPAKWSAALKNTDKCTCYPYMTLHLLNCSYSEGLARQLVENNIMGLFTFAKSSEFINENVVQQAAENFVSRYGKELSVFGALLYFAQYPTDHKSSYGQFDLMDILRQCAKSFLPKWRLMLGNIKEKETVRDKGCKETGRAALYTYLRREYVAKGIDIRTSPLVQRLPLSEKELQFIESCEPMTF
ncbi:MAG: hypothetical protein IKH88_00860 [Prevotella sp.]|nr:hypothetical protein [Prevotella sp.]